MNAELEYFIHQMVNSLSLGSMYSMIAVGYSMVYSLLYQVNFAHGDLYVFGTFIAFSLASSGAIPLYVAIIIACLCAALIAMTIERTVYRPVRGANRIVPMISALGAAYVLRTIAQVIWGPEPLAFPPLIPRNYFSLGNIRVQHQQVLVFFVALIFMLALTYVMQKTKFGKATQCIMQDVNTSALMGIPVNKIIPLVYGLGGFFGVIGGVLYSSVYNIISIDMGIWGTTKAWAAAMLGGVGSIYGSFLGGLLFGLAETMAGAYISTGFKDAIGYIVIVVILLFRPTGLFGKTKVKKV